MLGCMRILLSGARPYLQSNYPTAILLGGWPQQKQQSGGSRSGALSKFQPNATILLSGARPYL